MTGHMLEQQAQLNQLYAHYQLEIIIPPTINYETPDPECDLDYVPNIMRASEVNAALNNSLGFGGHNTTLCLQNTLKNIYFLNVYILILIQIFVLRLIFKN